jgi:hypothetical protein
MRRSVFFLAIAAAVCGVRFVTAVAGPVPPPNIQFTPAEVAPAPEERIDSTYQWSLAMPSPDFERRAYLWIPPQCKHVRGVVVGLQNMLEKLMFQNGDFRDACAAADVAIVYIAPGSVTIDKTKEPALALGFKDPKAAIAQLDQLLNDFAGVSGYTEIATAPLIPIGHSAATPVVWGVAYYDSARCIAVIPYKGWFSGAKGDLPFLHVSSEWGEVGGANWGQTWQKNDRGSILKLRAGKANPEIGEYVELGNGHFAWQPASGRIIGEFIRKTVAARVSTDGTLKPLPIESGVLVVPTDLGTSRFKAYSYNDCPGDKQAAYWYIDAEMAQAINDYMAPRLVKKPQVIDVLVKDKPAPLDKGGMADYAPTLLPDGVTWKVSPCYLKKAPPQLDFGDQPLGHSNGPVYFKVTSGAIKQTGPDTFKVWLGRGGIERQGNPWDPWAIAAQGGDDTYRSADRPVHFWIPIRRKDGKPQQIAFPDVPTAAAGSGPIKLHAVADSGLPVQYYVVSGPVDVAEDGTVTLLPIPPNAKYPVAVMIGAFQWGRGLDPKFSSAEPVVKEFSITAK